MIEMKREAQETINHHLDEQNHSESHHDQEEMIQENHLDENLHLEVQEGMMQDQHVHDFPKDHFPSDQEEMIRDLRLVQLLPGIKDHSVELARSINLYDLYISVTL